MMQTNQLHTFFWRERHTDRAVTSARVTLDAYALLDVSREPLVLHIPRLTSARSYLVTIDDWFDDNTIEVAGIAGPKGSDYVIVGPDAHVVAPQELPRLAMRCAQGMVAVRFLVRGEQDVSAAAEAQTGLRLSALGHHGRGHSPRTRNLLALCSSALSRRRRSGYRGTS